MQVTTVGLDLAKRIFQVHGVDAAGKVVIRRRLQRSEIAAFFADLPACLVGRPMLQMPRRSARRSGDRACVSYR